MVLVQGWVAGDVGMVVFSWHRDLKVPIFGASGLVSHAELSRLAEGPRSRYQMSNNNSIYRIWIWKRSMRGINDFKYRKKLSMLFLTIVTWVYSHNSQIFQQTRRFHIANAIYISQSLTQFMYPPGSRPRDKSVHLLVLA